MPSDASFVVNPRPRPWTGLVELEAPVPEDAGTVSAELPDGTVLPVQETARSQTLLAEEKLAAGDL
ncbi:MAG: hypothetical protein GWN71_39790, partial [Gammaproteobacteria bacterium]|nr:hypothetical protein [Gammaproteobacteria bacterium]